MLVVLFAAQAHEFWLQADRYFLKTGEATKLKFMVGEDFTGGLHDGGRHENSGDMAFGRVTASEAKQSSAQKSSWIVWFSILKSNLDSHAASTRIGIGPGQQTARLL